jgi:hypothetical protein
MGRTGHRYFPKGEDPKGNLSLAVSTGYHATSRGYYTDVVSVTVSVSLGYY